MRHDYVLVDAMPYFPSVGENLIVHSGIGDRLAKQEFLSLCCWEESSFLLT